ASHYLAKLVRGGFKVVLCEQLTKPQPGIVVKRGVTQVFTPGTLIDEQLLDDKSASYLLTIAPTHDSWGVVFSELLTAQLFATRVPAGAIKMLETELTRFSPDEVILPSSLAQDHLCTTLRGMGYPISFSQAFDQGEVATAWIEQQFNAAAKTKLQQETAINNSLHTLYWYLKKNQAASLPLFKTVHLYDPEDYLVLDAATQKNLELLSSTDGSRKHSLYAVLDRATTSMGSRTIKKWLQRPLIQEDAIKQRQEVIKELLAKPMILMQLEETLHQVADLERIIGRIALEKATLRDYQALQQSLVVIPALKKLLNDEIRAPLADTLQEKCTDLSSLQNLLASSINDDTTMPDALIKQGFNLELDSLRHLATNAQQEILALEQREISSSGIGSLKIRFNNITGYYIEITNTHEDVIPSHYRHVQTLANRKRFTNDALISLERNINRAQQDIAQLEQEVFAHVKQQVYSYLSPLRHVAQAVAYTDALVGLARTAYDQSYVQPLFNDQQVIDITGSRHPVVENQARDNFVKNNVRLHDKARLIILTGPNMGGKSTYLRQVALTAIMAQMGSFVPATAATLPLFDRIFTRIGSGDNLASGKSTFLVEMEETATICTQATKNSLVILDEVGRGTSTYDGMALAQAIIEHIATKVQASCLFATHYHELTALEKTQAVIKNYHAECIEQGNSIIFTHRIKAGAATQSFGLHVAHLAALPAPIVARAEIILDALLKKKPETISNTDKNNITFACPATHTQALKIVQVIQSLDLNTTSPKEVFDLIWKLQKDRNL
ncbi:DNA mismatch repair protein MutS, partial [Candidatus Dependentiae bacterium]|nr:DNA mismatch repair protein MutS [Candidatus Dependentiae bacterium]